MGAPIEYTTKQNNLKSKRSGRHQVELEKATRGHPRFTLSCMPTSIPPGDLHMSGKCCVRCEYDGNVKCRVVSVKEQSKKIAGELGVMHTGACIEQTET